MRLNRANRCNPFSIGILAQSPPMSGFAYRMKNVRAGIKHRLARNRRYFPVHIAAFVLVVNSISTLG